MVAALCGGMDEEDRPCRIFRKLLQHADCRSDSDASAQQHDGLVGLIQYEIALRNVGQESVALIDLGMEIVGDEAVVGRGEVRRGALTLDTDSIRAAVADLREAVLTYLLKGRVGNMRFDGEVLAGTERRKSCAGG